MQFFKINAGLYLQYTEMYILRQKENLYSHIYGFNNHFSQNF